MNGAFYSNFSCQEKKAMKIYTWTMSTLGHMTTTFGCLGIGLSAILALQFSLAKAVNLWQRMGLRVV